MVENDMYVKCNICKRETTFDFTQIITDPQKFILKCIIHTKEPNHELYSSYDKYVSDVTQNNLKINNKPNYPLVPVRFDEYEKWFIGTCLCLLCKKLYRTHYMSISDHGHVNVHEHIKRILSKPTIKKFDFGKLGVWYDCSRCNKRFFDQEDSNDHINKCVVGVSYNSLCNYQKPKYETHVVHK
jgi:DNA-directed RNA polymerase subunit RPC12/RpoP